MKYKGKFVVLTKIEGEKLVLYPLRNTSIRGWVKKEPKIGEQLFLYGEKECKNKFSWISKITMLFENYLVTEDSAYKIELEFQRKVEEDFSDLSKVTRLEIINHQDEHIGRVYTKYGCNKVGLSLQDDGKTLKIFIG